MKRVLVLTVALTLLLTGGVWAGANPDAKLAIHVLGHSIAACKGLPVIANCGDIVTSTGAINVDVVPVWFDMTEYQGFDYGIEWTGSSMAFTGCAQYNIIKNAVPPDPPTAPLVSPCGISHAWDACQVGPVFVAGWGWVYSYGMVCPIPHPITPNPLQVADCSGQLEGPVCLFCAGTNGFTGDDPCAPTATEARTWGGIKSMFK